MKRLIRIIGLVNNNNNNNNNKNNYYIKHNNIKVDEKFNFIFYFFLKYILIIRQFYFLYICTYLYVRIN